MNDPIFPSPTNPICIANLLSRRVESADRSSHRFHELCEAVRDIAGDVDPQSRPPLAAQRLQVARGLRPDQGAEVVAGVGNLDLLAGIAGHLQAHARRGVSLVELPGRVQVAGAVSGRRRAATGIADGYAELAER